MSFGHYDYCTDRFAQCSYFESMATYVLLFESLTMRFKFKAKTCISRNHASCITAWHLERMQHEGDVSSLLYTTPPPVEVGRRPPGGGGGGIGRGGSGRDDGERRDLI